MNKDSTYIINPAYFLRNDIKRAIIGTFDFPQISQDLYEHNCLSIIHPFHAQMLSFFDGTRNLRKCIYEIATYFDIKEDIVARLIENYIENPNGTITFFDSHHYYLPKNVLIEKQNYIHPESYNVNYFSIACDLDVESIRLYKPIKLVLETNLNCYTDCEYCYADRHNPLATNLVSVDTILKVISEAKDINVPSIELNGGEVLLHPHINNILEHLDRCGYHPFISTKIPLSKEKLFFLKNLHFTHIQISIDTLVEEELCRRLNVKKGYGENILRTMLYLDELDFNWQVNIVLTKNNVNIQKHIEPLLSKLFKYKNIKSIKLAPVSYSMYKNEALFSKIRPSLKDLKEIEEFIMEKQATTTIKIIYETPTCTSQYRILKMSEFEKRNRCVANQSGLVILPNGDVTICEELYWHNSFILGNISKCSIEDIWRSDKAQSLFNLKQEDVSKNSNCSKCDLFSRCRYNKGVCWKMVIMAYGFDNWLFPDPSCPKSNDYIRDFAYERSI